MTSRVLLLPVLVVVGFLLVGCGLLREPEEASGPIEAIPLEVQATVTAEPIATVEPVEEEVTEEAYPAPDEASGEEEQVESYPSAEVEEAAVAEDSAGAEALRVYQIVQEASQALFELDEDLRGQRTTVVGTTNQVAGELAVNLADLSTAQIGTIQVNARTLLTDNNFRNRAIHNEILETGVYEFITFAPTAVKGLPDSVAVGEEVSFTIEGDLTIRDVTQPATFEVTAVAVSETELAGTASSAVEREAFGLTIPEVRNVANVEEVVALVIEFVARA
ncbi:MAG: YceI family protein [Chloroflexota bacterium]